MPDDPRLKLTAEDLSFGVAAATIGRLSTPGVSIFGGSGKTPAHASLQRLVVALEFVQAQSGSSNLEEERLEGEQPLFEEVNE